MLSLLLTALLAAPQTADTPKPAPSEDANKRICRQSEGTGSRLDVKRVCMTKAEWAAASERAGRDLLNATSGRGVAGGKVD